MIQNNSDEIWMHHALNLASQAEEKGEVPVGAVVVLDEEIIGEGSNSSIKTHDPTGHAEIIALRHAGQKIKNYRLLKATLFVTLEPCIMCASAMIHARISRLVFGTHDKKTGAAGSLIALFDYPGINFSIKKTGNVLEQLCSDKISNFFRSCRTNKKIKTKK
ncbi:cytosine/adenosine deaminase [secondary endosymbiont of Heteropsylla cubana]|uniref:tRNA-specific adenosine deaminase n=1 Tax=secondary endosymbiont of Heteropsylla cubana TaxID=134287 RepID=J3YTL5_9ENTR|nr:tRNA adenosine(34) deaminase TadA [secondary endosymbiont of Heteropsylla cubana]AFP85803.1 cytosine/adenosine deaminase [secondary endosymbiont of Heteropsylla cubana]